MYRFAKFESLDIRSLIFKLSEEELVKNSQCCKSTLPNTGPLFTILAAQIETKPKFSIDPTSR